jgi:hypothetical protein
MKIKKYKNGTIKMTADSKKASFLLTAMLSREAGKDSNFAKLHQSKINELKDENTCKCKICH